MSDIGLRIKSLVDTVGNGNISKFARMIGSSEARIRSYIFNDVSPGFEILFEIATKLNIDCQWLLTGKGTHINEGFTGGGTGMIIVDEPGIKPREKTEGLIPYYNVDFEAGFSLVENDQRTTPDAYLSDPLFAGSDCVVRCSGDSMSKLIPAGALLGIKQVPFTDVLYGEIYALVTKANRTVKYVRRSKLKDHILLVPENTAAYDAQDYPIKKVISFWRVMAYGARP